MLDPSPFSEMWQGACRELGGRSLPKCTEVTHVPSYTTGRADSAQFPKTPSPRWYGLVSGSCARVGSLQPSRTSMTFAEAPKARAMSVT